MCDKPYYERHKKKNNLGKSAINTLGAIQINIPKGVGPVQQKFYLMDTKQFISKNANNRIENKNFDNNNNNVLYQHKDLKQNEMKREKKIPLNNVRPSSCVGKINNVYNTYDHFNINNKNPSISRSAIEAKNKQPENRNTSLNHNLDINIKNHGTLQNKKSLNDYLKNKDNDNLPVEIRSKELKPNILKKGGMGSYKQRAMKGPQDHKKPQGKHFEAETPIKNKFEKEPSNSIKNESSNKIESSSKKGSTYKKQAQKHGIQKKGLKLVFPIKEITDEVQAAGASAMDGFRGRPDMNKINKLKNPQQALKPNNKPIISQEEDFEDNIKGIKKSDEDEIKNFKNEMSILRNKIQYLQKEKERSQNKIKIFEKVVKDKDNKIEELNKQLEEQKQFFESEKISFYNQRSKLEQQLKEKIEELQKKSDEKDNIIDQLKEKLKTLNKEDNKELIKKLKLKDSEIYELKSKLDSALILNKKLKLDKEKMKTNNINNEDLQKELTKNLKEREKEIKNKEKEINERLLFIEDIERALESKQNKLDSEKKFMTDNYQNLQKEITNLNNQKMQLENQIHAMNQQIKSFNPNPFNNNMNPNFMNMNNNMNIQNNMNNNPKFNTVNTNMVLNRMNNNMAFNSNYNIINNMNNMMNNNMMQNMNMNNNMIANNNMNMNNFNNNMNNNNIQINNNKRNNNNNINPPKASKPLTFYKGPTLIGLQNIGATCFMNATLQCLSQTEDLTNYFLDEKRSAQKVKNNNIAKKNRNDLQLTPVYLELVKNLWDKNNSKGYVEPKKFMKTVEEMNPLFKLGQPGDSKDFIIFVLEQFHNELKKENKNNNNDDDYSVNQYDKNNAFNYFLEDFSKQTSIISDIFYGILETNNICLYCKNKYESQGKPYPICYNYQVFNCLIFPLEEVRKMKNGNIRMNNINMSNNNEVTLQDCFIYNQKTDHFTGENKNHCNICKQLWDSLYTSRIYSGPNVLVLILNRGKNNIYNVKLNFTETIDITQFVLAKIERMVYKLVGVITHYGQSGPNAHFMAFCKSPIDNKWYRYNDAIVTEVKNLQRDVIDFGTPYILFYRKEN